MSKRINKRETTTFIVAGQNTALATGALNTTGASFNILDGQIGVLSLDENGTVAMNNFIPAATTSTQVSKIQVVRGTPASADIATSDLFEVGHTALVKSDTIHKEQIVSFTGLKLRTPRYSVFSTAGLTNTIVKSNTTYKAYLTLDSTRKDRDFGDNQDVISATFTTGDVSTITSTNRLNYLISNVVAKINSYSKQTRTVAGNAVAGGKPIVALAVNSAGGTGVAMGTVTCGTSIPFYTDRSKNTSATVTSTFTANLATVRALAELLNSSVLLTPASTIEVVDLSTASTTTGIDTFVVLGLEDKKAAYFDDIEQVNIRVDVSLGSEWGITTDTKIRQDEGSGQGWKWTIDEDNRARLQVHTMQKHPFNEYFSQGLSYVNPALDYNSYILEYFDVEDPLYITVKSPKKLVILVPATSTCVTATVGATAVAAGNPAIPTGASFGTTITSLNATLGAWLESARPYSGHTVGGNSTNSTYFA